MGTLYVVATPIGNLSDLSPRAAETLLHANIVACEDTRRTGKLMQHIGAANTKYVVVNEHSEFGATNELIQALNAGQTIALVSDAGTPAISDPVELLVRAAIAAGHNVITIPGASAAISALSISGLDTRRFIFEGFLPRDGSDRTARINAVKKHEYTTVLYEAPHRLQRTLADMHKAIGDDRQIVLARELTKMHEDVWRGTLGEAIDHTNKREPIGEYVIILEACPQLPEATQETIDSALMQSLHSGLSVKGAANEVAEIYGLSKRDLYERALQIRPK